MPGLWISALVESWRADSAADELCPCCGIQFGYDDAAGGDLSKRTMIYQEWRKRWIARGIPWDSAEIEEPPHIWNLRERPDKLVGRNLADE